MSKEITIRSWHRGRSRDYTGTLEELTTRVFGYTLECGHSCVLRIELRFIEDHGFFRSQKPFS